MYANLVIVIFSAIGAVYFTFGTIALVQFFGIFAILNLLLLLPFLKLYSFAINKAMDKDNEL